MGWSGISAVSRAVGLAWLLVFLLSVWFSLGRPGGRHGVLLAGSFAPRVLRE